MASKDLIVRFVGDTGNLERGLDGLQGRFRAVATGVKGIATAGAVVAGVSFFGNAIKGATDLAETTSKVNVIFGDVAPTIERFAAGADKAFGLSKQAALDASATFATFGKGAGLAGQDLAEFSIGLVKLTSDLASFSNTSPEEAIEAVGAALRGENDPIEKYGILLNEAKIQQRGLKLGLIETTKDALTPQQKVLAAQAEIFAQTSDAQGDFARTSAGAAGQQKILAAQTDNAASKLGDKFLPLWREVVTTFNEDVVPAAVKVGDVVGNVLVPTFKFVFDAVKNTIGVIAGLPAPVQLAGAALLAWKLTGDKVTEGTGRMRDGFRTWGDEVRLQTALGGEGVSKFAGHMAVLQNRVPAIGAVGTAFRNAKGDADGFGATIKGLGAGAFAGLRGAAGGLVSFLGGPWGAGLALGAAGLGLLMESSRKAAEEQAALKESAKEITEVLREQKGVVNEAVRAKAAERAQNDGLLDIARQLGVALPDITDAILGQGDAYDLLQAKLHGVIAAGTEWVGGGKGSPQQKVLSDTAITAQELSTKVQVLTANMHDQAQAQKNVAEATKTTATVQAGTATSTDMLKVTMKNLGLEFDETKTAASQLATVIKNLGSEQVDQNEAIEEYESSIRELTKSIKDNGTTLDVHSEKGQNNRDKLEAVATAIKNTTVADIVAKVPMEEAIRRHDTKTESLRKLAAQLGLNKTQTQELINKYAAIPKDVRTIIKTQGYEDTLAKLRGLEAHQHALQTGTAVTYSVKGSKQQYKASGGFISGPGTSTSDSIPAWLSDGEYVISAAAVGMYGRALLDSINRRQLPRFAAGGPVKWPFPVDVRKTMIPTPAAGGAGVARWAGLVAAVLAELGQPAGLLPNVLRRMNQESGGNPLAVNRWDSNALRGTPSKGLMQVIDPTFSKFAGAYRDRGIFDPHANVYAGLNYAQHRYPSLQYAMDKPGGYKSGGEVHHHTHNYTLNIHAQTVDGDSIRDYINDMSRRSSLR